jgi:hypothetical protein
LDLLAKLAQELRVTTDFLITGKESILSGCISTIKADTGLSLDVKKALITLLEQLRTN